jgi:RNA polymerase sigma-70 factor, ECF subfamily
MDESTLVSLLKQGNEDAYGILIRQFKEKIYRIAYGITLDREESMDITQDVFIKIHQKINSFEEKSSLSTWIHRITVNQCLNWQRRWKRRFRWHHRSLDGIAAETYAELESQEAEPHRQYEEKEFEAVFHQAVKAMPEETRVVFVLKELEGLSYAEIAETLNIKPGTVSSRLFTARKQLKKLLTPYRDIP